MVIEFAGAELFDTLAKHGRLPEETARSIFQQLVSAVAHSHKCKVIHRDLKPENSEHFTFHFGQSLIRGAPVLIDWSGPVPDVKVIDFGLSNVMTDGDFLRTSCGSPCYACPEYVASINRLWVSTDKNGKGLSAQSEQPLNARFVALSNWFARVYAGPEVDVWSIGSCASIHTCPPLPN